MIRRPLLYGAIFVVMPVIIIEFFGKGFVISGGVILFLVYMLIKEEKLRKLCRLCLAFYLLAVISIMLHSGDTVSIDKYAGEQIKLKGEVIDCRLKDKNSESAHISIEMRQQSYGQTKLIVTSYNSNDFEIVPGDSIEVNGILETPQGRRNPNAFDYKRFLESDNIYHVMRSPQITTAGNTQTLRGRLYKLKSKYIERLRKNAGDDTAAFISGILFGDKSMIDDDILEEFQRNGSAHILAVSGLHIGIIYGFISRLWIWRKGWTYLAFNSVLLFCYCSIAAFCPSVVRASVMVIACCLAKITNRKYDLSSAAFAILIIMVLYNPKCIYNPGLQMSFLAVMSMSLIIPYIKKHYDGIMTGSMAIQIGLMPYTMYVFNYLPLGALLINVPIIMIMGALVPAALISIVIPQMDYILRPLVSATVSFNSMTCIEGATTFDVKSPPVFIVALFYLFMLVFLTEQGRIIRGRIGKRFALRSMLLIMILAAIFAVNMRSGFEDADVVFVDVGQGNCIHVRTCEGRNYLIDGGGSANYNVGKKTLRPYLLKNGAGYVDAAIVTHLHTDHYRGIVELCQAGLVRRLFVYESNRTNEEELLQETGLKRTDISYLAAGNKVKLGSECQLTVLWPPANGAAREEGAEDDENSSSLVMRLDYDGVRILVTGDVDSSLEEKLTQANRSGCRAEILSAAHHGSKYSWSESFARAVSPQYTVFQVGKNNYGHPSKEALDGFKKSGAKIYRNDTEGAIGFEIEKGRVVSIKTVMVTNSYHNHAP